MALVSVTRLRLRSPRYLLPFAWFAWRSRRQASHAPGHRGSTVRRQPQLAFWTLTVWEDEASMQAYRNSGAHLQAMPKLATWCDEAAYAHWEQEGALLPDWHTAEGRLKREGHFSRVKHPSAAQTEHRFEF
jgi:hypothetical protein